MFRVVIDLDINTSTGHSFLEGVLRFAGKRPDWDVVISPGRAYGADGFDAAKWRACGVISDDEGSAIQRWARENNVPIAMLSTRAMRTGWNTRIAQLAIEHLARLNFPRLAFVGREDDPGWASEKRSAFLREADARGLPCDVFPPCPNGGRKTTLNAWIAKLRTPVAIFAANDFTARRVLDACNYAGLKVPHDAAILGVDNDELICEASSPQLSSIALNKEGIGEAGAAALDSAMRLRCGGGAPAATGGEPMRIDGVRLVARASTNLVTASDLLAQRVARLVEERLSEHPTVAMLASALGVSRRTLETRFKASMDRTVRAEIEARRIARAKDMLLNSRKTQSEIAEACGFYDASHMGLVFRRRLGAPPSAFRK